MIGDHELRLSAGDCDAAALGPVEWEGVLRIVRDNARRIALLGGPDDPWMDLVLVAWDGRSISLMSVRLDGGTFVWERRDVVKDAIERFWKGAGGTPVKAVLIDMTGVFGGGAGIEDLSDDDVKARSAAMTVGRFLGLFAVQPDISLWRLPGDGTRPAGAGSDVRALTGMREELEARRLLDRAAGEGVMRLVLRVSGIDRDCRAVHGVRWIDEGDLQGRSDDEALGRAVCGGRADPGPGIAYELYEGAASGYRRASKAQVCARIDELRRAGGDGR